MLDPHPTPKLEDYPLLAVHYCLFNIMQLPSICGSHLPHSQPKDIPCHCDRGPQNLVTWKRGLICIMLTLHIFINLLISLLN